ncbi:haloacid dehalogenase superfamily, subfamily IA, variant 3 with third motif having DD or ED [Flagellimonas flava]|uniref:Haloacid dehalogenase superfamily, subfamily IA, variant 3 with third motif having DD or ED n=2 Tax=Flagellimonas flava TaxID=570519 RepID=A0A1M5ICJ0_9FLAO|nr:haloacid dehalogenase superfamily, subfamily IA, variant 3 with third motif having DD or ED [Allomuricauda flava]
MRKGGVIFDFNGTLFWDSPYQESSWDKYLQHYGISLTKAQKREYIHGRNGKDTFEILFGRKLSAVEIHQFTEEKEVLYRNECLKHKMELAPGAKLLLEELKANEVPMAIATASGKSNVDFFIDRFNLLEYFDAENIIYNDGSVKGKPHPEIFLKAMDSLGIAKEQTIIFEDSFSGIQSAINSKASTVIIVNSNDDEYLEFELPVINHFDEFDRNLLVY